MSLAIYFDIFLKEVNSQDAQRRLLHAFERLSFNIQTIESDLSSNFNHIKTEESFLASIDLINRYQDKQKYNVILLDEEKKIVLQKLVGMAKHAQNYRIVLYSALGDLVAYVKRTPAGFKQVFVSYEAGNPVFYRRYNGQSEFVKEQNAIDPSVSLQHQTYYEKRAQLISNSITHHKTKDGLLIQSHHSFFYQGISDEVAHIEYSRLLDNDYFSTLSDNFGIYIGLAEKPQGINVKNISEVSKTKTLNQIVEQSNYQTWGKIAAENGDIYIHALLEANRFDSLLNQNRLRFFLIFLLVIVVVIQVTRMLIRRGITYPLKALMAQVRKIEQQDYSASKVLQTEDELQKISANINNLAQTIQQRERMLFHSSKQLEYLSNHDVLTGLGNRRHLTEKLAIALRRAQRQPGYQFALLFVDLDEFKQINDTLGHDVGDELLVNLSARFKALLPDNVELGRIGGDEFQFLIGEITFPEDAGLIAEQLKQCTTKPFQCGEHSLYTTISTGIVVYPKDGKDKVTLYKNSDLAMYQAKNSGGNSYCYFSEELAEKAHAENEIYASLKKGIDQKNQFVIYYQPKFSKQRENVMALEALVRWNHPTKGMLFPDEFIDIAEERGLIVQLERFIVQQACHDFSLMLKHGLELDHLSINLSTSSLADKEIFHFVEQALSLSGMHAKQLEIEITERYIAVDADSALETLNCFRAMGIGLAIDDFGTGYSSMSYLHRLPITRLKIDKSFVDDLPNDENAIVIVKAIINLATSLGLSITAEGVETQQQLDFISTLDCDEIQGFIYSKPLSYKSIMDENFL